MKKVLEVKGMTCGNCVKRVTKIISGFITGILNKPINNKKRKLIRHK